MAALRVILARQVANDLEEISSYVSSNASSDIASDLITEILDAIERLAKMPGMGHVRPDLPDKFRVWPVFRFLIIYRYDKRALFVDRVVHGSRDIRSIFDK